MKSLFRKQFFFLACISCLTFVLSSCGDDEPEPVTCETTDITYTNFVKSLMDNTCASSACHSTTNKDVIGSLANYADVSEFIAGGFPLLKAINHEEGTSAMPKSGDKLSDCEIDKITAWINDGAPE